MLDHCYRDLLPFSRKSNAEVRHWCWAISTASKSTFRFMPKVFDGVEVRDPCRPVNRGSSSRAEMLWTDLFERWHPMTVPHWKSVSSSVRLFYWQCLSMEIAWLCAQLYIPVSNRCGWNSRIHEFEGVSTYFCIYSVLYIKYCIVDANVTNEQGMNHCHEPYGVTLYRCRIFIWSLFCWWEFPCTARNADF